MLPELINKVELFKILYKIDIDLANKTKQLPCPYCGSVLHTANYDRKPRGVNASIPDEFLRQQSLCCSNEECRKRVQPQSVRFMGRYVYWMCVILVVMALRQNRPDGYASKRLIQMFGCDKKTLCRWIEYFQEKFPSSSQWKSLRGKLDASIDNNSLPGDLVYYFINNSDSPQNGLIQCLIFISSTF
jgi:hypothetical protein